ncbi:MAG TPA: tetratricopeptide repeat protein [Burkholderiales bacterium]|nr:tetratricopeptide repeat protein [Burkholderiales bacterium]
MLRWLKSLGSTAARADAYSLMRRGEAALAQGLAADAAAFFRGAIAVDATVADYYRYLALACRAQGDFSGAEAAYRSALRLNPDDTSLQVKLGVVYTKLGRLADAQRWLEGAARASPEYAEAHLRLGDLFLERCEPALAVEACREAVRLEPRSAQALVALGRALEVGGSIESALDAYEAALRLDPQSVDAHVSRATTHLAREQFGAGWDEFEWRKLAPEQVAVHERFPIPDWDGSDLRGRTLLFYAEQGLGDQIMYASCVPDLQRQAGRVVIDCDPRLVALLRRSFPPAIVHGGRQSDDGRWSEAHGLHLKVACASAPRFLRRSAEDFPGHRGYLRADPSKVAQWKDRLAKLGPGRKVGLSWRGGVQRTGRAWRSLEIDSLLPLLRLPGIQFVSVQYDATAEELARLEAVSGTMPHWPEAIEDYDETAALLCALDITVSVCTAVIHLAGALGLPVWILAPIAPDARYGRAGERMRWYPSARMFRQPSFGDWRSVVDDVANELRHLPE